MELGNFRALRDSGIGLGLLGFGDLFCGTSGFAAVFLEFFMAVRDKQRAQGDQREVERGREGGREGGRE